ncbi:MAG: UDP-N-acetylmuramate dehydrogenase [Elusimicrobia bacterium]|nr:UDP-N-acetylmuramate dehydrogenase [Elusimicrobiota bacterium]
MTGPPGPPSRPSLLRASVPLAPLTTLRLGGPAAWFCEAADLETVTASVRWAAEQGLALQVLGEGSNVVFPDEGFPGLVLKVGLRGVVFQEDRDRTLARVGAGEPWDPFVRSAVERGLAGLECLSGIPGTAGATPIQNVGAYGAEVADAVDSVLGLDLDTLQERRFAPEECGFGYRTSRFKTGALSRVLVTEVSFRLTQGGAPTVRYPELASALAPPGSLAAVREAVLALRKRKGMVLDPADPHSVSAGSFFTNPVLDPEAFGELLRRCRAMGIEGAVPSFPAGSLTKVPAAWLVEKAGFAKGFRKGGVGVSAKHSLALVNYGGTTRELLSLARQIQEAVSGRFGVRLEIEPVVV